MTHYLYPGEGLALPIITAVLYFILFAVFLRHHSRFRTHFYALCIIFSLLNVVSHAVRASYDDNGSQGRYRAWDLIHVASTFFLLDAAYSLLWGWRYGVGIWETWFSRMRHGLISWIIRLVLFVLMVLGLAGRGLYSPSLGSRGRSGDDDAGETLYDIYVWGYLIMSALYFFWALKELFTFSSYRGSVAVGNAGHARHYLVTAVIIGFLLLVRYVFSAIAATHNTLDSLNLEYG